MSDALYAFWLLVREAPALFAAGMLAVSVLVLAVWATVWQVLHWLASLCSAVYSGMKRLVCSLHLHHHGSRTAEHR